MTAAAPQLFLERDTSRYLLDGARVPSVTEILALAGVVDFAGVPEDVLEAAAQRGRAAHAITALHDVGADATARAAVPSRAPELSGYLEAWKRFRRESGFAPELVEHALVNRADRYAGTLDRAGRIDGGTYWILDLKTGSTVPRWVGLQLAGYELALRETLQPRELVQRAAVRISPDGSYVVKRFADFRDMADFRACARVAHWKLAQGGYRLP